MKASKRVKLQKATTIEEAGARRAIEQAASLLDPYADDPQVSGLADKLRASVQDPVYAGPGDPANWGLTKAEESLAEMADLRKRDDLDPDTAERVRKANRDLQAEHLAQVSPAGFEAWRAAREAAELPV